MDDTRSPLAINPAINLPPESSTVNYEAQDEKVNSEYQVLWSNIMDEGQYKNSSKYTNVEVLLLCWAKNCDDLTITEEVSRLKRTFEDRFNYGAQIGYLDASMKQTLQVQVNRIVANFVGTFDGPNTLLIVYYAGHGKPGSYYGSLEFFGQTSENDQQKRLDLLVWNKTEKLLLDAGADVLEIFDCCYAGNLSLTRGESRLFEFLGATKEMATTPVPGPDSFTEALIWALEKLAEEKGRFTTVELLRKIKLHAPNFPKDQTPVLSDRKDEVQAGRIMLHPLHRIQKDGSRTALSSEENTKPDAFKRRTVTLHFDFGDQPSHAHVEMLGRQLNQVFERNTLDVNRVRWGGMKKSLAARAIGSFRAAGLKRNRRVSMEQQQNRMDDSGSESRLVEDNLALRTPSSSNLSPMYSSNSLDSNEESEGQIEDRGRWRKKQKSAVDSRNPS